MAFPHLNIFDPVSVTVMNDITRTGYRISVCTEFLKLNDSIGCFSLPSKSDSSRPSFRLKI